MADTSTTEKTALTEIQAKARQIHVPPRKARLVADLVRNMNVEQALSQLEFTPKKAAAAIAKLIKSATANAIHNHNLKEEDLFIKALSVDEGRVFKKYRARAQGRAMPVRRRTSHINLVLGIKESIPGKKTKKVAKQAEKEPEKKEETATPIENNEEGNKPERFWNKWGSKRQGDRKQQDETKGKSRQRFDRRGNM